LNSGDLTARNGKMLTTVIGAYPKPEYLNITDWFRAKGGTDTEYPTKFYSEEIKKLGTNVEKFFLNATKDVINDQIECGIDVVTDGEVRRENYIHYHCRHIDGIDFNHLTKKSARTGNYECYLPTIINKVKAQEAFLTNEWLMAQNLSSKPVKATIPGPLTIADTIGNNFYSSTKDLTKDLSEVINVEIKRLYEIGCKHIQIDEPLFARKPEEAINFGIENLERCFFGCDQSVEKITHICCGYPDKIDAIDYNKAPLDSYFKIASSLEDSIIDTVSIEDAHRHNDLQILEIFKNTNIILGLVKIASSEIETVDEIDSRIKNALKHINKERLIAAPDCGLGHLSRELATIKLKRLVSAAKLN
tara:strand:+ start:5860 stop:6942 length:1083 start_codon:yes stop_codon:yes gene_type:complete